MNRYVLLALLCALLTPSIAYPCNRCGIFRGCKYCRNQVVAVTPVVALQQPSVFIVNNQYPPSLIAAQGASIYGYQQAASAYFVSPAEVLRQAAELSRAASVTAQLGLTGFNQTAQTQLALQASITEPLVRGQAAAQVLTAAGLSQPSALQQPQSVALRISIVGGQLKVEQVDAAQVNARIQEETVPTAPQPTAVTSILGSKCAACHGLSLAEPRAGLFIDAGHPLDSDIVVKALRMVKDGKMPKPPKPSLTPEEKGQIMEELLSLSKVLEATKQPGS